MRLCTLAVAALLILPACSMRSLDSGANGGPIAGPMPPPVSPPSPVSPPVRQPGAPLWPMANHDVQNRALGFVPGPRAANVRWTAPVHPSSVIVGADGTVYVADLGTLRALDGRSGAVLWSSATGKAIAGNVGLGSDGTLYNVELTSSADTALVAREPGAGMVKWRIALPYLYSWVWVDGDRVYLSSAVPAPAWNLYAVDSSGQLLWQHTLDGEGYVGAVGSDGAILVWGDRLWSLDGADGHERWSAQTPLTTESTIVIGIDGTIFQTDMNGPYTLVARSPADGKTRWSLPEHSGGIPGAAIVIGSGGDVQLADGDRYAAFTPSGQPVWSLPDPHYGFNIGSLVDADGVSYVVAAEGKQLLAVAPDGTVSWTWQTSGWATLGALGDAGWLYVLDSPDGILNDVSLVAFGP